MRNTKSTQLRRSLWLLETVRNAPIRVGLRIDSDTLRGTLVGTPELLSILAEHNIYASFFFSVGPDNMGRNLWRLFNPKFLYKMLRSNAPGLYGWDILLRGLFWPGPNISQRAGHVMHQAAFAGHEVGFHAWDHYRWQRYSDQMSGSEIYSNLSRGIKALTQVSRSVVTCTAAAGWKCTETALKQKNKFNMLYNSDCRGQNIFRPEVDGQILAPQIPVTLPTYDELIGRDGVHDGNYNQKIMDMISANKLNVLTIHTEVEGISRSVLFREFLTLAKAKNIRLVSLCDLLPNRQEIPLGRVAQGHVAGRAGRVCIQA